MDFDGDGTPDLISGSYAGGVYFFKGRGHGVFEPPVKLLFTNGTTIKPDEALAPAFGDWTGHGRLDMVLGTITGRVLLLKNDGHGRFAQPVSFTVDGSRLSAPDGGPCLYDFTHSGKPQLLLGDGYGGLTLYRRRGSSLTDLTVVKRLVPPLKDAYLPRVLDKAGAPSGRHIGYRLKPTVVDWNGDGKPDIVVGDAMEIADHTLVLSAVQRARKLRLERETAALQKEIAVLSQRTQRSTTIRVLPQQSQTTQVELRKVVHQLTQKGRALSELEPHSVTGGFVWVFLGE